MRIDYPATILKIRAVLNLTQEALAKLLGVSFASVNRWENGKYKPTSIIKEKIRLLCEENTIEMVEIIPDYALIKRVCDLTCSKEDVVRNQTTIKYDPVEPFRKYYHVRAIVGALNKYLDGEWDDLTLSHWACVYNWILCGGFGDEVEENWNRLERFLIDVISWDLDGLSFYDEDYTDDVLAFVNNGVQFYKDWNHIWQTRNGWRGVYAPITKYAEFNGEQYVVLVNDALKEYMIMNGDHLKNGYKDKYFRYVPNEELIRFVAQLKEQNYRILPCDEEYFYSDISEEE